MVRIQSLNGETCSIDTSLGATLSDVKAQIHKQLGHSPCSQTLLLGETKLVNTNAVLADLGISAACTLTLVVVQQPMGQSSLAEPSGRKRNILPGGYLDPFPRERLNEFEYMSWQAVCKAHEVHDAFFMDWGEDKAELGASGADLYWKTCSDGCRYEYWSADPGDNEYGVLVRVDATSMVGIGYGSDDGLEVFDDFADSEVVKQLIREGWPRPNCWKEESDEDDEDDEDDD